MGATGRKREDLKRCYVCYTAIQEDQQKLGHTQDACRIEYTLHFLLNKENLKVEQNFIIHLNKHN
jgi:hypothetical protein